MRVLVSCTLALSVVACGPITGSSSGGQNSSLTYLLEHGMPGIEQLIPSLPAGFSRVAGVATDADGMPSLPSNLAGTSIGGGADAFSGMVDDARSLSAQGFSEARRIEALMLAVLRPAFNVLGQSKVFANSAAVVEGASLADRSPVSNVFNSLTSSMEMAIALDAAPGMPGYLVLGKAVGGQAITIKGLFPQGDAKTATQFFTGFSATLRIAALDDFDLSLAVQPALLGGAVSAWKELSCADDVLSLELGAKVESRSLTVKTHECPSARNSVTALTLANEEGVYALRGAFAQTFTDADDNTLRGWLGARQGFVLQAATDGDLDKVAASAAVLRESDFGANTQDAIARFGVGQLLADYVQARYWTPRLKSATSSSFDSANYSNPAHWFCKNGLTASTFRNAAVEVKSLCAGDALDVERMLSAVVAINDEISSVPLVPADMKKPFNALTNILQIRNTIFLSTDTLAYRKAPDDAFLQLDNKRSALERLTVDDKDFASGVTAALPKVAKSDIPEISLSSITGALGNFVKGECGKILADAREKAGKDGGSAVCL